MSSIHGLAGLPRSGSTLLGNILSQNPAIYVSGSSPLVEIEAAIRQTISNAPDVVAELAGDKDAFERYKAAMAAFATTYHKRPEAIVFDKGRLWSNNAVLMRTILPDSTIIVTVRDPRDIVASIERQHRKTGIFTSHTGANDLYESASQIMSPKGSVGLFILGIEDMIRRELPNVVFVRFESLVVNPQSTVESIYSALGKPMYKHDFNKVVDVSPDIDAVYRFKFPHDGSGKVSEKRSGTWKGTISKDIADSVAGAYPGFMKYFGYV